MSKLEAQITNGNNREIFDIAEAVLRYIFLHSKELETRIEDKEKKYIITREIIIKIFYTDREKYESNYELFNINRFMNKRGNSLHQNVLEAVKLKGSIDARIHNILVQNLGHDVDEIQRSLEILESRVNRLIVPIRDNRESNDNKKLNKPNKPNKPNKLNKQSHTMHTMIVEYEITKKGEKYLEMVDSDDWKCYRDLCGYTKDSLRNYL